MESEKRTDKRTDKRFNDIFLIIVLLAFALIFLLMQNIFGKNGANVIVMQDGEIVCEFSLKAELEGDNALRIETTKGYNILEIKDSAASITCADCPDGLCVKQKAISKQGESLICLPHKLVITVEGAESSTIDAVAH